MCSAALLVGASAFIVAYLTIALMRLWYPFELEWMEGGVVAHVQQVLDGRPLYAAPTVDFVPFDYTPLYFYVSSVFAAVIGNGFVALRLVSLLASIGSLVLIFLIVRRQTSSAYASLLASALFAATFKLTGGWLDIARVDSLFIALLLAAIYAFDSPRIVVRSYVSPGLLFLSFLTKQTALFLAAPLALSALFFRRGHERLAFALVFCALVAFSTLGMNAITGGWYRYYVFDIPASHGISRPLLIQFWTTDLSSLCVGLAFCVIAILVSHGSSALSRRALPDGLLFGGLLMSSYLVRIHPVAYVNTLLPAAAAIAIYFGVGFSRAAERLDGFPIGKLVLLITAGLQFLVLVYSPRSQLPSVADRLAGEKLLARIAGLRGEVYWPEHPWYLTEVGKPRQAHDMSVYDVVTGSRSSDLEAGLRADLSAAVASERYVAFVLDGDTFVLRPPDFDAHYVKVDGNLTGTDFLPVTGMQRKPSSLFVRRGNRAGS